MRVLASLVAVVLLGSVAEAAIQKPAVTRLPAHSGNYTRASRTRIDMVVIHKAEGENAAGWFANPAAPASAHYDVHKNGRIYQSVADDDIAWHAGNWSVNERSIGIEHGGWTARNDTTEAQYRASAKLTAWICKRYGIPIDRRHIIGHVEVPGATHTDPGRHWNWSHYLALVRQYAGASGSAAPAPSKPSLPTGTVLKKGSRGPAVTALQRVLDRKGFDPGPVDGIFGVRTDTAVRRFQRSRGLAVDGVVGPRTWAALAR